MARRNDHSREEIMEMAVKQGAILLAESGLAEFSARKLAASIGYTVGTLYNVFGSYEQLMLHINARTLAELEAALGKANAEGGKPKKKLRQLTVAYLEFAKAHYQRWLALFEYHLPEGGAVPDWYGGKLSSLFSLIERPLQEYAGFSAKQAAREARALWAGVHGVCVLGLSGKLAVVGAQDILEDTLELVLTRYLEGIGR